jgi:glycine betaine/proline transport system ATP-binding protein
VPAIVCESVDIVFGDRPQAALALLDQGLDREAILAATGQVLGVAGCSIGIEKGEICVLMGLSGSGKSTLLRAINGLARITRGRVLIEHEGGVVDVAGCSRATLRMLRTRRIAMVFQQFALLPWRTVAENVGLGLELRGTPRAERERVVREMLELVCLEAWGDKHAHELSGGMQQRVGLARAFATDADILLMDEPFSALDPLIRDRLQDELLELQQRLHKTIVFVSHDLDEALKLGNRIAIMEGGRIVQEGDPESIVTQPATDYVQAFVSGVNPLNVLRGATLMRPRDELTRDPASGLLVLDERSGLVARLDGEGRIAELLRDGRPVRQASADGGGADAAVTAGPDTPMRVAIEVLHTTGLPLLLQDEAGRLMGVVGSAELLEGLLRRPRSRDRMLPAAQ